MPLYWRIFLVNAVALTAALAVLVVSPLTISTPIAPKELAVLLLGFVALMIISAAGAGEVVRAVTDLREAVAEGEDEPVVLPKGAPPDLVEVAAAHNLMLERLDIERVATARAALSAQEDERARLAGELHDQVGQSLTFMLLKVTAVSRQLDGPARTELESVADAARTTMDHVRTLARQLRPGVGQEIGLKPALVSLVDDVTALGVPADLDFPDWFAADAERDLAAYRIVQEALANAVKHAGASKVTVGVRRDGDRLVLWIEDDGNGRPGIPGAGTASMSERARLVGGTFERTSSPGEGTTVTIDLPFAVSQLPRPARPFPTVGLLPSGPASEG